MVAVCSSETSGSLLNTWRYNQEDHSLHTQLRGKFKFKIKCLILTLHTRKPTTATASCNPFYISHHNKCSECLNTTFSLHFNIIISGVRLSPLGTAATIGLLYQPQMTDDGDCGTIGGIKIGRGNRSTRRKPAPLPLCPPQIPHDLTRARARATAMGSLHMLQPIAVPQLKQLIACFCPRWPGFDSRTVHIGFLVDKAFYFIG
jgi:hypothetical protein